MSRSLALVTLASVAVVATFAAGADATYSGKNGRIAFARMGANVDVYSVLASGGGVQRLTSERSFDACPSWSRDGQTIAYCSNASGSYEIWTMRPDGSGKHRETNVRSNALFPDISPDGRKIVFADCARTCRVMVVDRATGRESVLVDDPRADDEYPVWSPNGKLIAFLRTRRAPRSSDVFVARANGSGVRRLTRDRRPKGPYGPDWKPNGKLLAYAAQGDIWTATLSGRTRRVTKTRSDEFAPVWSPDGSRIACVRGAGAARRIHVMNANGSGSRAIGPGLGGPQLAPGWQPG